MFNPDAVVHFFRWLLGLPEQPQAQLIPIEENDPLVGRARPPR